MTKPIKKFMIEKGFYRNDQKVTIPEMISYVDEWQEELIELKCQESVNNIAKAPRWDIEKMKTKKAKI